MPTTTRKTKNLEEEKEGILSDSHTDTESENELPEVEDDDGSDSEGSEDPNFELPDDIEEMDADDDMYDILSSLFATDEGDNVCTALLGIKDSLDTQNKILLKIAMSVSKKR